MDTLENKEKDTINSEQTTDTVSTSASKEVPATQSQRNFSRRGGSEGGDRVFKKNKRRPNKRRQKARSEFDQKILDIRRVTRVSSGGRRFSFAVSLAAGDKNGRVGVGTGKAGDTSLAIEKAFRNAKKNLITVRTDADSSISHEIKAKYNSARIMMMPAKGRGIIAGSAVRDIIDLAGLKDINAKIISGSKNKLNISRATLKALGTLKAPKIKSKKFLKDKE